MKRLTKTQLIVAFKQGCLNEYGKTILIKKLLKLEEKRREEIKERVRKTMKRKMKAKWKKKI